MLIKKVLENSIKKLKNNNIEDSRMKAKILLAFILDKPKSYLITHDMEKIDKPKLEEYNKAINKILKNIPIQYIINQQEFMKLKFYVDENVLIPRADTEILVEEVLNITKNIKNPKILDLCTGSGAIAISISHYLKNSNIHASDISKKAIQIAEKNAKLNNVKLDFIESDLFDKIEIKNFDIIVSNPPYIKRDVIKILDRQVQKEPLIALDGGIDGLDFYRKIIEESKKYLNKNGYLCLEIGYDQKEEVLNLFKLHKEYYNIYAKKDLAGNDRIIIARKG